MPGINFKLDMKQFGIQPATIYKDSPWDQVYIHTHIPPYKDYDGCFNALTILLEPWHNDFTLKFGKTVKFPSHLLEAELKDELQALPLQPSLFINHIEALKLMMDWRRLYDDIIKVKALEASIPRISQELVELSGKLDAYLAIHDWEKH